MKVLGRGWQYTTYDLGNGRVLKKYNSSFVGCWVIFRDFLTYGSPMPWRILGSFQDCREKALVSIQKVINGPLDPWMIGTPKILNELDYEQDKLTPLHSLISKAEVEEGKRLVDEFVGLNKTLVERGLIDKNFNITQNFGLDSKGRVVLMDLGELYSDRVSIDEQQRKRMWANAHVAKVFSNKEAHSYYVEQMDKNFGSVN